MSALPIPLADVVLSCPDQGFLLCLSSSISLTLPSWTQSRISSLAELRDLIDLGRIWVAPHGACRIIFSMSTDPGLSVEDQSLVPIVQRCPVSLVRVYARFMCPKVSRSGRSWG